MWRPAALADETLMNAVRRGWTNAIESLNTRYRRAVRARGHFPNDQAARKCLYLVTRFLGLTGQSQERWTMRWKPALNEFATTFADRWPAAETS